MDRIADFFGWFFLGLGAWVMVLIAAAGLVYGVSYAYQWWHHAEVRHDPDICSACRWNQDRTETPMKEET